MLIVAPGEIFGGAERQILTLVNALKTRVSFSAVLFFDGPLAARLKEVGIDPVVPRDFAGAIRNLKHLANDTDVLHAHGYKASIAACLALRLKGHRILKTMHGAPEFRQRRRLASMMSRIYYALELALDFLSKPTQIFVTNDLKLRWPAFAVGRDARVIYNGVAVGAESAAPVPRPLALDGSKRALIVGRLDFVKGVDVALEAMSILPEGLARLTILGDGPEKAALQDSCFRLGVEDRVTFKGFVSDPSSEMSTADVMLMPSRHEGLPYTLLEAMRARTPIIASRVGGIAEVLDDGIDAILVPPEDAKALCHALHMLLENSGLAERLAGEAHQKLLKQFSDESMAHSYLQEYLRIQARAM